MIPLLIAFGLTEFSVTPSAVLKTRKTISLWSVPEAQKLTEDVMQAPNAESVKAILEAQQKK